MHHAIEHGNEPVGQTTADIAGRLPKRVTAKNGEAMSLEAWHGEHGELRKYCDGTSFADAAAFIGKGTVAGLTDMAPAISEDDVHPGEGF